MHGKPDTITHDNGLPYDSREWRKDMNLYNKVVRLKYARMKRQRKNFTALTFKCYLNLGPAAPLDGKLSQPELNHKSTQPQLNIIKVGFDIKFKIC